MVIGDIDEMNAPPQMLCVGSESRFGDAVGKRAVTVVVVEIRNVVAELCFRDVHQSVFVLHPKRRQLFRTCHSSDCGTASLARNPKKSNEPQSGSEQPLFSIFGTLDFSILDFPGEQPSGVTPQVERRKWALQPRRRRPAGGDAPRSMVG